MAPSAPSTFRPSTHVTKSARKRATSPRGRHSRRYDELELRLQDVLIRCLFLHITLPLGMLSFGLFFPVINAVILWFSSRFVPGFAVTTFKAAFPGALALAVLHLLFGFFVARRRTPIGRALACSIKT